MKSILILWLAGTTLLSFVLFLFLPVFLLIEWIRNKTT
jgi:hypothetical protein